MKYGILLSAVCLTGSTVVGQGTWQQPVEPQPSLERGAIAEASARPAGVPEQLFEDGPTPEWIWGPDNQSAYVLSFRFDVNQPVRARLKASCDNIGTVFLNGRKVAASSEWQEPMDVDVTDVLVAGKNHIEAEVANAGGAAAFVAHLVITLPTDNVIHVVTGTDWTVSSRRGEAAVAKAERRGTLGDGPWGEVFDNPAFEGRVPREVFETLPGFQVEKLFTVPQDELGSWVCITFDQQGRLLASDQGDKGICRITLPPHAPSPLPRTGGATEHGPPEVARAQGGRKTDGLLRQGEGASSRPAEGATSKPGEGAVPETIVERLDFSRCEFRPTAAQGMLWAFDSLYLSINGGPGSGLYRARDTDGDDQFDECVRLKEFRGGGEHGPHALRLSPDGKRIFVICGNHTQPPFQPGDENTDPGKSSRVPTNWDEDLLLPRMWDANGHARGILAPGGWIASTDPDGESWDILSIGYRNPYDMAFNADGELLAYDADMEWDMGLPWYRPTRVVHATPGSDFGWRSGSGKWPVYYTDSLPPLVNIGPGSPVGVEFGYGLKFPDRYQKALYICDWTFGTMYAIHTEPHLSSYTAAKEEFLSRTPLPLTDVAAGPDGVLYFTVGGRGTQSELYRVLYTGPESTAPAELHDSQFAPERAQRAARDAWSTDPVSAPASKSDVSKFLAEVRRDLNSGDRFLIAAVRNALLRSPAFPDVLEASLTGNSADATWTPDELIAMAVTLSRVVNPTDSSGGADPEDASAPRVTQPRRLAHRALTQLDFATLNTSQQLDYLRALSLVLIRLSSPDDADRNRYLAALEEHFPAADPDVSRELCQMLVHLQSPHVVSRTIALMQRDPVPTVSVDLTDLITRNPGYGRSIASMLSNAPDQQQVWYAYCLRCADAGWTLDTRAEFFRWCGRAKTWSGGNSYRKFIQNMEDEAWSKVPENERVLLEAMEARAPFRMPELPKPAGPGHDWTLEDVRALAATELHGRDFENGQKMFAATRCVLCHRFVGDGGATGPDLTTLAGRFTINDLTEAILDPSKVVSDQYKGSTVVTTDGRTIAGRIISESPTQLSVLTDPEDSTKIVDIARSEVDEILPATASLMPRDLLRPLNQDEVLDLLAYLLSRGDPSDPMFRRQRRR